MGEVFATKAEPKIEHKVNLGAILNFKGGEKVLGTDDFNDKDTPASLYEERHGYSITAKIFNMKYAEDLDTVQKLNAIDNFIQDKLIEDELEDTQISYKIILDKLMRTLGIDPNSANKLSKIYEAVVLKQFLHGN